MALSHLDAAYNLARWVASNEADADDIVQEAYRRAFQGTGGSASVSSRVWLLTIVLQSAYSWLRKNQRETIVFADHLGGIEYPAAAAINSQSETLERELIAVGGALRLRAAIRDLPFPFRETLVLRDLENLNYEEIAQVTKASIGTVMTRLGQARRRLLATIAKGEP